MFVIMFFSTFFVRGEVQDSASSCSVSQITDMFTLLHSEDPKFVPRIQTPDEKLDIDWWELLRDGGFGSHLLDVQTAQLRGQQRVAFFPYLQSRAFLSKLPGMERLPLQQTVKLRGHDIALRLHSELCHSIS